jgi:hypothetical protein
MDTCEVNTSKLIVRGLNIDKKYFTMKIKIWNEYSVKLYITDYKYEITTIILYNIVMNDDDVALKYIFDYVPWRYFINRCMLNSCIRWEHRYGGIGITHDYQICKCDLLISSICEKKYKCFNYLLTNHHSTIKYYDITEYTQLICEDDEILKAMLMNGWRIRENRITYIFIKEFIRDAIYFYEHGNKMLIDRWINLDLDIIEHLCEYGCKLYNKQFCWFMMIVYFEKEDITVHSVDRLCRLMLKNTCNNRDEICDAIDNMIDYQKEREIKSYIIKYLYDLREEYKQK